MANRVNIRLLVAIQAALVAATTAAGANVYLHRVDEIVQAELPVLDIASADESAQETIERASMDFPYVQRHVYAFTIAAVAAQTSSAATVAANLAQEVEECLLATRGAITLDGKPIDLACLGASEAADGSGSMQMHRVSQAWTATYHTQAGTPDAVF